MVNKRPKIISNELDQAPKTGERYQERIDSMKDEIAEAMDKYFSVDEDDIDSCKYFEWLESINLLPLREIVKKVSNNPNRKISYLVKKDKIPQTGGWRASIGSPKAHSDINNQLGEVYYKTEESDLGYGEIGIYITFSGTDSGNIKVITQQVEMLPENTMISKGFNLCQKILTPDEFIKIMDEEETKVQ